MNASISKEELKELIFKLISAYLDQEASYKDQTTISITEDYFWNVEQESLYNISEDINPKDITLGSLHDALMELRKLTHSDYIPNSIDIRRVSFIIRYLSNC